MNPQLKQDEKIFIPLAVNRCNQIAIESLGGGIYI